MIAHKNVLSNKKIISIRTLKWNFSFSPAVHVDSALLWLRHDIPASTFSASEDVHTF